MKITIETTIAAPINDVWWAFNDPDDILQWDACDDWRTVRASNHLEVGGKLLLRVETNDESAGFDFVATYTRIELNRRIEFREDNGRRVRLEFINTDAGITVRQTFDADSKHPEDSQRSQWQAVLDRFAGYVERHATKFAAEAAMGKMARVADPTLLKLFTTLFWRLTHGKKDRYRSHRGDWKAPVCYTTHVASEDSCED